MFDIVVAVNNEAIFSKNLLRSPLLNKADVTFQIQRGYPSAGLAYNSAINKCHNEFIVFVHQDVYIPAGWEKKVMDNISCLDRENSKWAVLGIYGVMKSGHHVGYVWSSGLNKILGTSFAYPIPVDTIDELLIIVNKSSGISFDENLPGYHLYGTDLVQTALEKNRAGYVICAPVIHNSMPILYLGDDYFRAYSYVANKWQSKLPIQNCVSPIFSSKLSRLKFRIKHQIGKLRYLKFDRHALDRNYDCIEIARRLKFE